MSEADPVRIPIEVNDNALDTLIAKAEELDDKIRQIKEDLRATFQQATGLPTAAQNIPNVVSGYRPEQLAGAISPQFAQAYTALQARQQTIAQSVRTFAASPSFPSGTPVTQQLAAFTQYAATHATPAQTPSITGGFHPAAAPTQVLGGATVSLAGPGAGVLTPGAANTVANAIAAVTSSGMASALRNALGSSAQPALMSALRGGMGAGMGALARTGGFGMFGGALSGGLYGLGPAGLALGAGAGLLGAVSQTQATLERRQALLQSSEFALPDSTHGTILSALQAGYAGQAFNYDQNQAQKTAVQLAMAGVNGAQLGGGLASTFALGRVTGQGPDAIAPLTSALMTQGGMSHQDVAGTYQRLINMGRESGVSVNRLVDDLKDLVRETGNAAVNISGLTAVQKMVGAGVNAGQLLAPALGANGTTALAQAAILGVSPDQFAQMQRHPAQMFDAMAGLVKRIDRQGGAQGAMVAEQVLQQTGLMDFTGVSPKTQLDLINLLRAGKVNQAQALAQSIARKAGGQQPESAWLGSVAQSTQGQTSAQERAWIAFQNFWTGITNSTLGAPPPAPPFAGGHYTIPTLRAGQSYGVPSATTGQERSFSAKAMQAFVAAANKNGVPLDILLAQAATTGDLSGSGAMSAAARDARLYQANGGNWITALNTANPGQGPQIMNLAAEMIVSGRLDVTDSSGKVIGTVTIERQSVPVKHKPDPHRQATGHTSHAPGGGGHARRGA